MPLPLPDLDTRRWADLVEEGRALLPRYAPTWTDHNVHDPGITLLELFAWLVEQDIYQVNRIPERHRRKFLALAGFRPQAPQPAETALSFTLAGSVTQHLPAGLALATAVGLPFHLVEPLTVVPAVLQAVQVDDGAAFVDKTRLWRDGLPFALWGNNPDAAASPALYLGFNEPLPVGEEVTLWFWLANERTGREERERLLAEVRETAVLCQPLRPQTTCTPGPPCPDPWCPEEPPAAPEDPATETASDVLAHHAVDAVWEYFTGAEWLPLTAVADHTRGFTLDGAVQFTPPAMMGAATLGAIPSDQFYVRCRLQNGRSDAAPTLQGVALNTALVRQARQTYQAFPIAPGVTPPPGQEPVVGAWQRLALRLAEDGQITHLAAGEAAAGPRLLVLAYTAATVDTPGSLTATITQVGRGRGLPEQALTLRNAPIAYGSAELWLDEGGSLQPWRKQDDFDAAKRPDAVYTLDAATGAVRFGDGDRGRVPPAGAAILAAYATTAGAAGNVPANSGWQFAGVDDTLNAALLGSSVATTAGELATISNQTAGRYGHDQETLTQAAGRAAETLWAHERLLELLGDGQSSTLDQLEQTAVLSRPTPQRATTLLDYERLALTVPGSKISRARAWAGLDPHYPCLQAPGTVTVVIVPALPAGAPEPTAALLDLVFRYLNRRRIIGTRLVVVGPGYLEVTVQAEVRARRGADGARVQAQIERSLNAFLDPLSGGPNGRGWPFGRDVYRAEILQVIDNVPGVDHVLGLELIPGDGAAQCANLCVGPTWLVRAGEHRITVV